MKGLAGSPLEGKALPGKFRESVAGGGPPAASPGAQPGPAARNDLEIQVFGLQRSGNHGVIAWMLQQFGEPVVFLNNITHFGDPFTDFHVGSVPNMARPNRNKKGDVERLRIKPKPLIVISYEGLALRNLAKRPLMDDHDARMGRSAHVRRLLLLRDFFNWAASRLKLIENRRQDIDRAIQNFNAHIGMWLAYAGEFAGGTSFLGEHDVVKLNYNRWTADAGYRAYLLGRLRLPLVNTSNQVVPDVGGGSSFEGTDLTHKARDMKVEDRWQFLLEDRFKPVRDAIGKRRREIETLNAELFRLPWVLD